MAVILSKIASHELIKMLNSSSYGTVPLLSDVETCYTIGVIICKEPVLKSDLFSSREMRLFVCKMIAKITNFIMGETKCYMWYICSPG